VVAVAVHPPLVATVSVPVLSATAALACPRRSLVLLLPVLAVVAVVAGRRTGTTALAVLVVLAVAAMDSCALEAPTRKPLLLGLPILVAVVVLVPTL
jgi:uncharacterized membrane protein (DUF441 family)